ncbi:MAG: hypothetical protein GFH27_549279n231 [Chloroflexi bacterium AL-W]|nr:hypothetical protein [Chloroflexi bacterium AL-N1]NOK65197.1 hypothetical protein [Chloroflexi bacterium AL-N10]NOK79376.1 hypothetical protein [Chloroflexi bacterium AL-W]NOK87292.1 hypothetical protein [Chloroflexi bacterium AL-N15]
MAHLLQFFHRWVHIEGFMRDSIEARTWCQLRF